MNTTILLSSLLVLGLAAACEGGSFSGDTGKAPPKGANAKPANTTGNPGAPTAGGNPAGGTAGGNPGDGTTVNSTGDSTGSTTGGIGAGGTGAGTPGDGSPDIPTDCTSTGVTQANLLTKDLTNYATNVVEYEVYLTDCDGKIKTLNSEFMSFDVNATAAGIGKGIGLSYEISDSKSGGSLANGTLAEINGTDLFGNAGSQYYHYQTEQPVKVTSGSQSFKLRITLPAACCTRPETGDPAGDQLIDSFLKLGKAAPVKKVVHFKGALPPPN